MELREIRSFVVLSDLQNITRAAEVLHLSPAAVHKQIKMLEQELGARLYEKAGRRLRLTQAGETLLPFARDLMVRYRETVAAFDEWKEMKRGLLRLGSGAGISVIVLPRLLSIFRSRYPDIEVTVDTGSTASLIHALGEAALDAAMFVAPEAMDASGPDIVASWPYRIVAVAAREFGGGERMIGDPREQPFVLFKEGSQIEHAIDAHFLRLGVRPRVVMRFDHAEAIKSMVRIGVGIGMLPGWSVSAELASGELVEMKFADAPPLKSRIVLAVRRAGILPPAVRGLVEIARQKEDLLDLE
ncbi:MAG: LysR family transcriptional regulator [Bryobacterales bacterium]|nr:LysR family transcriptional regulator [Bryobacterales bacterium]